MGDVDVIVIGSGAGGLSAAVALARAGKKVLVLEQHYLPGGWCQSFALEGYRFSPGVHYVGELGPGGRMRAIYEGLGLGDLTFYRLNPDGFDHLRIAGERFDIPEGREAFRERLHRRFPRETAGIDGYLHVCQRVSDELGQLIEIETLADAMRLPFVAPTVARWGLSTAGSLVGNFVKDPMLRAIFSAQAGDHGLPPSMASAMVHTSISAHYFDGGYYPQGGGGALPRAFIRALREQGGAIHVRSRVARILIEKGRAIGVRLADGQEIRAATIISNADPHVTFVDLVGAEHLGFRLRRKLSRTRYSGSCVSLFLAVDLDMRAAGFDSGNTWFYESTDIDSIYRLGLSPWEPGPGALPGTFLTVTTLKDPSKDYGGQHTLEAFGFVGYDAFRRWETTSAENRPEEYRARKRELSEMMLTTVEKIVPGVRKRVVLAELATPLTNRHYLGATRGNIYGTEKSRFQVGPFGFPVRTELKGLYLTGASTLGHGVMGATLSGLATARAVLGCKMRELLTARGTSIRILESETAPVPGSVEKAS